MTYRSAWITACSRLRPLCLTCRTRKSAVLQQTRPVSSSGEYSRRHACYKQEFTTVLVGCSTARNASDLRICAQKTPRSIVRIQRTRRKICSRIFISTWPTKVSICTMGSADISTTSWSSRARRSAWRSRSRNYLLFCRFSFRWACFMSCLVTLLTLDSHSEFNSIERLSRRTSLRRMSSSARRSAWIVSWTARILRRGRGPRISRLGSTPAETVSSALPRAR